MKSKKHTRLAIILSVALIITIGATAVVLGAGSAAKNDITEHVGDNSAAGKIIMPPPGEKSTQQVFSVGDVAEIIERNLGVIISSPNFSSNPGDYINAHKTEYDEIVALEDDALQYMFSLFDKGGQSGLSGHIMASACRDILGLEFEFNPAIDTGQKWYDAYMRSL
jgi:hypothetical protein